MLYEIMLNGRVIATVGSFDEAQEIFREEIGRPLTQFQWLLLFSSGLKFGDKRFFAERITNDEPVAA